MLDAAAPRNVTVVPGVWGLRSLPVGELHPDWRAVNENGSAPDAAADEGGDLCAASPYADTHLLPLVRTLRRSYGVRSFFLMELWQPWSLDFPERTSYSPFMLQSFEGKSGQLRRYLMSARNAFGLNPLQVSSLTKNGIDPKVSDFIWNKNRLVLEKEAIKKQMMNVIKKKPAKKETD